MPQLNHQRNYRITIIHCNIDKSDKKAMPTNFAQIA